MTIEEEFFKAFGIEPYFRYLLVDTQTRKKKEHLFDKTELIEFCATHKNFILLKVVKRYPEITAEKLLELICICSTVYPITINYKETVDELKEFILDFCIRHSKELGIKQICELFEE